ncbi:MAG: hypothetical protein A3E80_01625 [Chlamydiae bacterium RIFCSPHIGHO2_12_FULL_49_9]|nr:MAG: hypothetical protein A3E80_01625 [Chlamydiae bacterium RIFCSPHIGHO2_12_FULL_49_9]
MKKRPFVLLEVLLALFLVMIAIIPLVRQPFMLYRSEILLLEEMERERLADWTFSEIREQFLKGQIPWKKLPAKGEISSPFSLPKGSIHLPGLASKEVERSFTLRCIGEKKGTQGETYRSLNIAIEFNPALNKKKKKYTFRLLVQKMEIGHETKV